MVIDLLQRYSQVDHQQAARRVREPFDFTVVAFGAGFVGPVDASDDALALEEGGECDRAGIHPFHPVSVVADPGGHACRVAVVGLVAVPPQALAQARCER